MTNSPDYNQPNYFHTICPVCDGDGWIWPNAVYIWSYINGNECEYCKGTGDVSQKRAQKWLEKQEPS